MNNAYFLNLLSHFYTLSEEEFKQTVLLSLTSNDNEQRAAAENRFNQYITNFPLKSVRFLLNYVQDENSSLKVASIILLGVKVSNSNELQSVITQEFFANEILAILSPIYLNPQTDSKLRVNVSYFLVQATLHSHLEPIILNLFLQGIQERNDLNVMISSIENITLIISNKIIDPTQNSDIFQELISNICTNTQLPPQIYITTVSLLLVLSRFIDLTQYNEFILHLFANLSEESPLIQLLSNFETNMSMAVQMLEPFCIKYLELFQQMIMSYSEYENVVKSCLSCIKALLFYFPSNFFECINDFISNFLFDLCTTLIESFDPSVDVSQDYSLFGEALKIFDSIAKNYSDNVEWRTEFLSYLTEKAEVKTVLAILDECAEFVAPNFSCSIFSLFSQQIKESLVLDDAQQRLICAKLVKSISNYDVMEFDVNIANEIMGLVIARIFDEEEPIIVNQLLKALKKYDRENASFIEATAEHQANICQYIYDSIKDQDIPEVSDFYSSLLALFAQIFETCPTIFANFAGSFFELSMGVLSYQYLKPDVYSSAIRCASVIAAKDQNYFAEFCKIISSISFAEADINYIDEIDNTLTDIAKIDLTIVQGLIVTLIQTVLAYLRNDIEIIKKPESTAKEDLQDYDYKFISQERVYACAPKDTASNILTILLIIRENLAFKFIPPDLFLYIFDSTRNLNPYVATLEMYHLISIIYGLMMQQMEWQKFSLNLFEIQINLLKPAYDTYYLESAIVEAKNSYLFISSKMALTEQIYLWLLNSLKAISHGIQNIYNEFESKASRCCETDEERGILIPIYQCLREFEEALFRANEDSWMQHFLADDSLNPQDPYTLIKFAFFVLKTNTGAEKLFGALSAMMQSTEFIPEIIKQVLGVLLLNPQSPFINQITEIIGSLSPLDTNYTEEQEI